MLSRLLEYQNNKIESARQNSAAMLFQNRQSILLIALATALTALLITAYIGSRYISQPILAITQAMGRLTDGDLTETLQTKRDDEIGQMEKALAVFRNNAIEKVHSDKKLQESEDRFRNLYNNAMVGLFRTRLLDGQALQINEHFASLVGYASAEECLRKYSASRHYADLAVRQAMLAQIQRDGEVKGFEAEIVRQDKSSGWVSFSARAYPEEGYIEGAIVDISGLKRAEAELVASLREKELLLREVHHRVKNNMQMIQSLINLQVDKIDDQELKKALIESNSRIRVMALVHETLYKSNTLSNIDLRTYFSDLTTQILRAYGEPGKTVDLSLQIAPLVLNIDQIVACGLIVNELMTNSLKYAFTGRDHGTITIRLAGKAPDEAEFTITDDGVGIQPGIDLAHLDSLGLRLVRLLAENQLDGSMNVSQANGMNYCIQFRI